MAAYRGQPGRIDPCRDSWSAGWSAASPASLRYTGRRRTFCGGSMEQRGGAVGREPGHPRSRRCVYKRASRFLTFWNLRAALYLCVSFISLFVWSLCASALRGPSPAAPRGGRCTGRGGVLYILYMHETVKGEGGGVGARLYSLCLNYNLHGLTDTVRPHPLCLCVRISEDSSFGMSLFGHSGKSISDPSGSITPRTEQRRRPPHAVRRNCAFSSK